MVYAGLGDKDQTFKWLEKGYKERPSMAEYTRVVPWLAPLHSDERYMEFLRKMDQPQ